MELCVQLDIVAEALLDWKVEVIFGLPGDGINGFIEALRRPKDKIKFILVRHEESGSLYGLRLRKIYRKNRSVDSHLRTGRYTSFKWII